MADEDQTKILADIRDVLREQLPELNRLTDEALSVQKIAQDEKKIRWLIFVVGIIVGASLNFFLNRIH